MSPDDPRREACRAAVYAALRQVCQAKALYRYGKGTSLELTRTRMQARAALAEHDRLALHRGCP